MYRACGNVPNTTHNVAQEALLEMKMSVHSESSGQQYLISQDYTIDTCYCCEEIFYHLYRITDFY